MIHFIHIYAYKQTQTHQQFIMNLISEMAHKIDLMGRFMIFRIQCMGCARMYVCVWNMFCTSVKSFST